MAIRIQYNYTDYKYSNKASEASRLINGIGAVMGGWLLIAFIFGAADIFNGSLDGLLAILPILGYVLLFINKKKICDRIAIKEIDHKLKTDMKFAVSYCVNHPIQIGYALSINPEIKEKLIAYYNTVWLCDKCSKLNSNKVDTCAYCNTPKK